MSDALARGRRIRVLAVVDAWTREAVALEVDTSLPGERVARVLERAVAQRGYPEELVLDNGPELTGRALDEWAHRRGVRLRFIAPGRPVQNAICESFNEHWFLGLGDARRIIEAWRQDYNRTRPHGSLGHRTPEEARRAFEAATPPPPRPTGLS